MTREERDIKAKELMTYGFGNCLLDGKIHNTMAGFCFFSWHGIQLTESWYMGEPNFGCLVYVAASMEGFAWFDIERVSIPTNSLEGYIKERSNERKNN